MASESHKVRRRKKKVFQCPNPLFEKWIKEWRDEALEKGWKSHYNYSKALKSLQKYPLPLSSGKEAKILEYFGDKICQMLDSKLAAHYAQNGGLPTKSNSDDDKSDIEEIPEDFDLQSQSQNTQTKRRKMVVTKKSTGSKRKYIPAPGSGPFAILVTLYQCEMLDNVISLKKEELIDKAQPLSEESFTIPKPGSYYTAWSSVSTLIRKDLVIKGGKPVRYGLTDAGRKLAASLTNIASKNTASSNLPSIDIDSEPSTSNPSNSQASEFTNAFRNASQTIQNWKYPLTSMEISDEENSLPSSSQSSTYSQKYISFTLPAGSFEVILCVDVCESSTGPSASRKLGLLTELRKNGVPTDVRKLHIGDFLWIAQEKVQPVAGSLRLPSARELVLDFVIERKRMDDLASSIKDGRFHEQKFRILNCGLRRPLYLVEDYGTSQQYFGIPNQSLEQAIINTQVIDGFTVKRTKDHKESVAYLTLMTRYLQSKYKSLDLVSCTKDDILSPSCDSNMFMTFPEFNSSSVKNKHLTVKEMFAKHLLQLKGLSVDRIVSILDHYPTLASLVKEYDRCQSQEEKEKLLSKIKFGKNQRNIGPALSKSVYQLYCLSHFPP